MFSRRVPRDLSANALELARREAEPIPFDLTVSNPTRVGIHYSYDLFAPLAAPNGLLYHPEPRGVPVAREAVSRYYARRGAEVSPDQVVLCASTSEGYGFLFKLLCDPSDRILVPVPSYPLFDHLAALEGVCAVPYSIEEGPEALEDARAVLVVHPNNPTGVHVPREVASRLVARCAEAGVALVADEVFLDYPLDGASRRPTFAATQDALTFTLGGLSKTVGLPQAKLAWIVVSGPDALVREALERLEYVADAYLSVATPVQHALPSLLDRGTAVRHAILARCRRNLEALERAAAAVPSVDLLRPEGGWSAVLRAPATEDDEASAVALLREEGVAVHPGTFFGFPRNGWIVVSLLPEPEVFDGGIRRLLRKIGER